MIDQLTFGEVSVTHTLLGSVLGSLVDEVSLKDFVGFDDYVLTL